MASNHRQFAIATAVLLLIVVALPSSAISPSRRLVYSTVKRPNPSLATAQDGEVVKLEGRIGIEIADYPGTGANNNHDPSPPGT